jgi:hypothetical protein
MGLMSIIRLNVQWTVGVASVTSSLSLSLLLSSTVTVSTCCTRSSGFSASACTWKSSSKLTNLIGWQTSFSHGISLIWSRNSLKLSWQSVAYSTRSENQWKKWAVNFSIYTTNRYFILPVEFEKPEFRKHFCIVADRGIWLRYWNHLLN